MDLPVVLLQHTEVELDGTVVPQLVSNAAAPDVVSHVAQQWQRQLLQRTLLQNQLRGRMRACECVRGSETGTQRVAPLRTRWRWGTMPTKQAASCRGLLTLHRLNRACITWLCMFWRSACIEPGISNSLKPVTAAHSAAHASTGANLVVLLPASRLSEERNERSNGAGSLQRVQGTGLHAQVLERLVVSE